MFFKHPFFLFLLSTALVLFLANTWAYKEHLDPDIITYSYRAASFLELGNVSYPDGNEYQPGAILLFIGLAPFLTYGGFALYKSAYIAANILFLLAHAYLYIKYRGKRSLLLFSIIILALGPIIFFRFELLVSLTVVIAILLWEKKHPYAAMLLLAVSVLIKVYPVIFIPYFCLFAWKNKSMKHMIHLIIVYVLGTVTFLAGYVLLLGGNKEELYNSLNYHALKPIGLESIWGTAFTVTTFIKTGGYPALVNSGGIWGIAGADSVIPLWFYNYFWLVPFILLHIYLLKTVKRGDAFDVRVLLVIILLFLIASKSLAPQYLIWAFTLIPLLKETANTKLKLGMMCLAIIVPALYQIIYPVNYTAWLDNFTVGSENTVLFFFNTFRDLLLLVLSGLTLYDFFTKKLTAKKTYGATS